LKSYSAKVVAQNAPFTPPMVSVAQVWVLLLAAGVRRTLTVSPLFTVPATAV
jgi:hypothetical protein